MAPSLYLINPRGSAPTYFGAEVHAARGLPPAVLLADTALPTLAALAPRDFDVTLCEEAVSAVDLDTSADFIGITGKISQHPRMLELAREFRRRGKTVIFGGCYASLSPERLRGHCDILVRGEIENIAEKFFSDLRNGNWQAEYIGDKPDLATSPVPRWDLYPNHRALTGMLQTSRGCPFECEFCDVIQYLGRKQRHKRPAQVLAECDELYRHGYRGIFLADDNFTVYPARTRELLAALRDWNDAQTGGRVAFSTQVSIDCTRHPDLLQLASEAGLWAVFVGIETPSSDSLKETKKRQNVGVDMRERIALLAEHGIAVSGGMIVGFDADTTDIFERQYEFAMSLPIPMFTVATLTAPEATPLYTRLEAAGRLRDDVPEAASVFPWSTNIVPKQMSIAELASGTRWLCNRLYRPEAFEQRVARFIDQVRVPQPRNAAPNSQSRAIDGERMLVARSVTRLGAEEQAMAARLERRLARKPQALPYVLLFFSYYMQIRFMYARCGIWDRSLGEKPRPGFNTAKDCILA